MNRLLGPSFFLIAVAGFAQRPDFVEEALAKPLLDPMQPMVEVQVYTAARVLPMPSFKSAAEWTLYASALRRRILNEVVYRGEARRWRDAASGVDWLEVIPGNGYKVRKLRFEVIPGLWVPALLYEPNELKGRVPAVLNVNGHEGAGNANSYIQARCINLAKKGLLALNIEWFNKGRLSGEPFSHSRLQQLDLTGTSGLSLFYLEMKRGLDILSGLPNADPKRIAVTGLSGGGWQTIFLSALDTRVAVANPVAGYSSYVTRSQFPELDLGDSEQTPSDFAAVADYTHMTALLAPRPAQLAYNAKDNCCFRADYAIGPLLQSAGAIYKLLGAQDRLRYHVNHGAGHNYDRDNREAFYRLLRDSFDPSLNAEEIPSDNEVRTEEQLRIDLPADNLNFHKIALDLAKALPRGPATRADLARVVRMKRYTVDATVAGTDDEKRATFWRLKMGGAWTVPAVELSPAEPKSTVILLADAGRKSVATEAGRLLAEGKRVVAVDPFYFGESTIAKRDYLFAFLIASEGERPLGIQAGQIGAVAKWLSKRGVGPVSISATGPRLSLAALVAAALEPEAIASLELTGSMTSLKEILEKDLTADKFPELFCFGLLESFDIKQIEALVSPRPVVKKGS